MTWSAVNSGSAMSCIHVPPASRGAARAAETPGTMATGTPTSLSAVISELQRENTEGQPPFSRTTRLPCNTRKSTHERRSARSCAKLIKMGLQMIA